MKKLVTFKVLQKGEFKFMFAVLGSVALTRQSLIIYLKVNHRNADACYKITKNIDVKS